MTDEPNPDELNADERAMAELVRDFVNREVKPVVRELEHANTYPAKLIAPPPRRTDLNALRDGRPVSQ